MLFIGNNRKIQRPLLVTSAGTCRRQQLHFCQECLFMCFNSVVNIATQVLAEWWELVYFCCYESRLRVTVHSSHQIVPSFSSLHPSPITNKNTNTCILTIITKKKKVPVPKLLTFDAFLQSHTRYSGSI